MRSVRWVMTGLGVGVVGGFVGGLVTAPRPETRYQHTWLPDGPAIPLRDLHAAAGVTRSEREPVAVAEAGVD